MANKHHRAEQRLAIWRVREIHRRIASGEFPNASTIAQKLEVSSKTIHRDLDFMRDFLQLPIAYVPKLHGYHYTTAVDVCALCQGKHLKQSRRRHPATNRSLNHQ